ncbi:MAG TPA: response regulator [Polyangia bacterium]|jgi:CheY-like chemotaxis protein
MSPALDSDAGTSKTRFEQRTSYAINAAIALSIVAVFVADALTPLGIVVWIFYVVPLMLCLFVRRPAIPLAVGVACTAALVIGYFSSTSATGELPTRVVHVNRGFGAVVIWAVAIMVRGIIASKLAIERLMWLRAGQTGLARAVLGETQLERLGQKTLEHLAAYLDAQVGALHAVEGPSELRRIAGFAVPSELAPAPAFKLGEGLAGQAAKQKKAARVRDLPDGYLPVSSALGTGKPRELLVAPLTADGVVMGVLELGFLHATYAADLELLELLAEPMGIALRSLKDRRQLEALLERTQQQAEELQVQQEELRVSNEELETQSKSLQESQARLEMQHAELEQTNSQLEEQAQLLVQQKTDLELSQEGLRTKSDEVERASRYKSEFLANMSHELRTPLNSSLILAKLLADNRAGNLTEEQVRFAQNIYSAGNDLLDLINDILDLSKIEAGQMDVTVDAVNLRRVADGLAQMFKPLANEKGIAFSAALADGLTPVITTDAQRLQQILKNLLSNALKFTERGEVTLRIVAAGPDRVGFVVRDTGIGIAPAQQQIVFEAFRQADGNTNRKYGGTGLGLSISRDLAHLLGGEITLESAPGQGSTFTLLLPRAHVAAPTVSPPPPRTAPVPAPQPAAPRPKPERPVTASADDRDQLAPGARALLVVEDDLTFAGILKDLAHELGFRCLVAHRADEGIELALQFRPTAIVLDMSLPDHSGLTVLDRLKRSPVTRHIPVQVVSVQDDTQVALEMGAAGYMLKPVKREKLVEALSKLETRFGEGARSVLVIEDDRMQRESICHLLDASDVRTVAVETAAAALEQLKTTTYDCVVLDISLPDASGFDLLEKMASEDQYSFPPVIVYTGRSLSSDEEQRLRRYSRSIIIKGARSPERLLDEVTLFLHQVEAKLPPERQRMLALARNREAVFENRKVLLVEDDVRNIFALSKVLEPKGANVQIARNGREALQALEATPDIDLVLMDIMMPEMDGYEAMREIRKRPAWAKLPIIALTAKAMRDDQERCLEAGANDYIAKPIEVEKLLSLMRVWMPR